MPSIQVLGCRFNVSSDDWPIPAAFLIAFHASWSIVIGSSLGYLFNGKPNDCDEGEAYSAYVISLMAIFQAAVVVELGMAIEGCKGSIFEESKRRRMPALLTAHFVVTLLTVVINVWGTYLLYGFGGICRGTPQEWRPGRTLTVLVWTTWVVLLLLMATTVLTLHVLPSSRRGYDVWKCRWTCISLMCCCRRQLASAREGEAMPPLVRFADLFYKFFKHMDFTPSDLGVTIYLAAILQRTTRRRAIMQQLNGGASPMGVATSFTDTSISLASDPAGSGTLGKADTSPRDGAACVDPSSPRLLTSSHMAQALCPGASPLHASVRYCVPGERVQLRVMQEAEIFGRFAMAAYGALYYVYANPKPVAVCGLCVGSCCPCCDLTPSGRTSLLRDMTRWQQPMPDLLTVDGAMQTLALKENLTQVAICRTAGIRPHQLIYVHDKNEFCTSVPYFIALEERTRSVVVGIRGTLSLDDTITDFMCHPEDFDKWAASLPHPKGCAPPPARDDFAGPSAEGGGAHAGHSGMMSVARMLVQDLRRHGYVEQLFRIGSDAESAASGASDDMFATSEGSVGGAGSPRKPHTPLMKGFSSRHRRERQAKTRLRDCRGWRLVLTGHSMGAGIAAFVGLYFRQIVPHVSVWCYSPPGWLMSKELAHRTADLITSVVLNKDIIPRLTMLTLEKLRDDLVMAGVRCKLSKPHVVLSSLFKGCCLTKRSYDKQESWFASEDECSSDSRQFLSKYQASIGRQMTDGERDLLLSFRVPGRIIFLRPLKDKRKIKTAARAYTATWIDAEDILGEGLLLSKHMMVDHLPDVLLSTLSRTVAAMAEERPDDADSALLDRADPSRDSGGLPSLGDLLQPADVARVGARNERNAAPSEGSFSGGSRLFAEVRSRRAQGASGADLADTVPPD